MKILDLNSPNVAQMLLGKLFVVNNLINDSKSAKPQRFVITETEYYNADDPASHAYQHKQTLRNKSMFLSSGSLYVYLVYGMHYCLNIVTSCKGDPAAVLIRGCVPLDDIDVCRSNRNCQDSRATICNGPAKLCKAMNIDTSWDACHLLSCSALQLEDHNIVCGTYHIGKRVGISKAIEKQWRYMISDFCVEDQQFYYQPSVKL